MPSAPSLEETDELMRSRKKIRDDGPSFLNTQTLTPRVEDWMGMEDQELEKNLGDDRPEGMKSMIEEGSSDKRWKSFKDVVNQGRESEEAEEDWWSGERWKERISVQMTDLGPNVIISQQEKERLAKRWSNALIVKLLGRMVDLKYLEMKVQQLWARQGDVDVIDIGMGFFVVQFMNASDYELALTGGPWLIFDHYLSVQPWKPDFAPREEKITKVAAWIRLDELSLDYYDKGILYVLGSQIGKVLKVDMNTVKRKKGRFARLCVELDLSMPLVLLYSLMERFRECNMRHPSDLYEMWVLWT